ncbi:MAG: antitoxin family protein [Phycisphaerales bacterium]|nr:antitoxin family protein [Phycisphaerales bacterium]
MAQMMTQVKAVFRHGVFEPLAPVNFQEEAVVELSIKEPTKAQPDNAMTMMEWLESVRPLRDQIARRGCGHFLWPHPTARGSTTKQYDVDCGR